VTADLNLTDFIRRMQAGDRSAGDSVFSAAASRLRKMAAGLMSRENTNGFHASDLVQEAFAQKVSGGRLRASIAGREHFFSLMAAGMRQILMDRGRGRSAAKRQIPPVEYLLGNLQPDSRLADLSFALRKLEKLDPGGCQTIRMKYQQGLTWEEIAETTNRSVWQVRAECDYLLRWLRAQLL